MIDFARIYFHVLSGHESGGFFGVGEWKGGTKQTLNHHFLFTDTRPVQLQYFIFYAIMDPPMAEGVQ